MKRSSLEYFFRKRTVFRVISNKCGRKRRGDWKFIEFRARSCTLFPCEVRHAERGRRSPTLIVLMTSELPGKLLAHFPSGLACVTSRRGGGSCFKIYRYDSLRGKYYLCMMWLLFSDCRELKNYAHSKIFSFVNGCGIVNIAHARDKGIPNK